MRLIAAGFAGLFCTALLSLAQEPVKPKLNPRIITATKQVTFFAGIEKEMLQAVQKKDKAALHAMLSDECTIHLPDSDLFPCDDWLESVLSNEYNLKSFVIRQMDVADLGNAAVVSYDRIQQSTYKGQNDGGEFYVVDQWTKAGDNWKLANRYVTKVRSVPVMPKGAVKPTGKQ
jgi:Domain of unknown function (DUF4440)